MYTSSNPVNNSFLTSYSNITSNNITPFLNNKNVYASSTPLTIAEIRSNNIVRDQEKLDDLNEILNIIPINTSVKSQWCDLF